MAPNAGDRHFRVFRVPASVFQVPVGGDGRPLADVLRGERAPMDALHRRPEAACPNVWQRIGVSEHDGRQAGAGPRSRINFYILIYFHKVHYNTVTTKVED